jgi:hypothetical protein
MIGEKVPLDMLFKYKGLKAILFSSLTEIPSEALTTIMQNGIDIGLLDRNMSFKDWKDSLLDTLIVTGVSSPFTAGLGRGLGVGTQRIIESRQKREPIIQVVGDLKATSPVFEKGVKPPDITLDTKDGKKIVATDTKSGKVVGSFDGEKLSLAGDYSGNRLFIASQLIDTHKTLTESLTQMESEAKLDLDNELSNQTQLDKNETSQREAEIRTLGQAGMASELDTERSQKTTELTESQSFEEFIEQVTPKQDVQKALTEGDFDTLTQYANNFPDAKSFAEAIGEKPRQPSPYWKQGGYTSAFDFYRKRWATTKTTGRDYEGFVNEDTGELIGKDYESADIVTVTNLLDKLESMRKQGVQEKQAIQANKKGFNERRLYNVTLSIDKVKTVIRQRTGQTRIDNLVGEMEALNFAYKQAEEAAKGAYWLGDKTGTLIEHERMLQIAALKRQKQAVRRETKAAIAYLSSVNKKLDTTMIPDNYRNAIKDVLSYNGEALEAFINDVTAKEGIVIIPDEMVEMLKQTERNGMTLEQLRNQKDIVKTLLYQGRAESKINVLNKKVDFADLVMNIAQEIADAKGVQLDQMLKKFNLTDVDKQMLMNPDVPSRLKEITQTVSNIGSYAKKVEYIIEKLTGFINDSSLYNASFQKTVEAERVELTRSKQISDRLSEAVKLIEDINPMKDTIQIPGMAKPITRMEAIMIALNSGAVKNREGLKEGWGLSDKIIDNVVLSLSDNETKFVMKIWDLVNDQYEAIDAEYLKLTGLHMKKVDGPYFPLKYDQKRNDFIAAREAESDLFRMYSDINSVFRGFTVERTQGKAMAPLLDFSVIINHLADTNHFVSWGTTIKDINRLINNPIVKEAMIQSVGEGQYEQLKPWLKGIANTEHYDSMKRMDRLVNGMINNSSVAILGYALSTSIVQPTALAQSINFKYRTPDGTVKKLGVKNVLSAVLDFARHPFQISDAINNLSIFMVDRTHNLDYNIRTAHEKEMKKLIQDKGLYPWLKDHAFDFIVATDAITTKPVWWAAYNQAMKDYGDQAKAIDFADKVVRNTQGSGSQKDLSTFQHAGKLWKSLTMFQTFFNATYNEWGKSKDMVMQKEVSPVELAKTFFWITLIPALITSILREREDLLEHPEEALKEIVGYGFGSIPIAGNAINAWMDNYEYKPSPIISALSDVGKGGYSMASGNIETGIKKIATGAGQMFGIPGTRQAIRIGEMAWDYIDEGEIEDPFNLIYKKKKK